jgi:hypothetical protein
MTILAMSLDICQLRAEEERVLGSFTRRLLEIATAAGKRGSGTSSTAALNTMRLPAIALDKHGFVADANAAANGIVKLFDVPLPGLRIGVETGS